jgi:biopolymer transport protein ExbD
MVTISKDGELYLADKPVNINQIGEAVREKYPTAKGVYLRADKGTVWDPIAQVINALGTAKMEVKVVTQPEDSADRPRRR